MLDKIYGQHLDDVIALLSVADPVRQASEVNRLKGEFRTHRAVVSVSLEDPGTEGSVHGQLFHYLRIEGPPRKSCSGISTGDQLGLTRCTWSYGAFNDLDVLRYNLRFDYGDETLGLVVEFDYDEVLEAVSR